MWCEGRAWGGKGEGDWVTTKHISVCSVVSATLGWGGGGAVGLPVNNILQVCVLSVRIFTFFVLSVTHSTLQLYFHLFKTFNNITMEEFWGWIVVLFVWGAF